MLQQPIDRVFHAFGDPTRRKLVEHLSKGPATSSQLVAPLGVSLTAVGQHLRVLEQSGIVRSEKVGRTRTCHLAPEGLNILTRWIDERRELWERRFDRLGDLLSEDEPS